MNIFLTGCTSYIGKYLAISFANQGDYVIGTSRKDPKIKNKNFKFIKHDLSQSPILKLNKKIDFFIHVAGRRMSARQKTREYINSNVIVTFNVQKMIKKFKPKLTIYTSSRSIYGDVKANILKETTNILNPNVYGKTKLLGEKILEEAANTISLRLSTVLAKGAPGWILSIYKKLLLGKKIKMVNTKINNFIHISDIFNIINFFFKKKFYITNQFNISCSKAASSKKIVFLMKKLLNSKSKIINLKKKENFYTISNKKLGKYLPTLSSEKAIYRFIKDYNKNEYY